MPTYRFSTGIYANESDVSGSGGQIVFDIVAESPEQAFTIFKRIVSEFMKLTAQYMEFVEI